VFTKHFFQIYFNFISISTVNKSKRCKMVLKLVLLVLFLGESVHSVRYIAIRNDVSNQMCMSSCVPYKSYNFCWTGWGKKEWASCRNLKIPAPQYYTSKFNNKEKSLCSSECMTALGALLMKIQRNGITAVLIAEYLTKITNA
jgi:hypothetical protein